MSIPTDITYTNLSSVTVDLSTTSAVNASIESIQAQMAAQGWTITAGLYATTTVQLGLPLIGTNLSGFSLVFTNYFGWAVQFFDSSAGQLGGHVFPHYWVDSAGADQITMATRLAAALMDINPNYAVTVVLDGSGEPRHLRITAVSPGASWNDQGPILANISSGGITEGSLKGGGWWMTSVAANGQSAVSVQMINNFLDCLELTGHMGSHALAARMIEKRPNNLSVVSPYMLNLFHRNDGVDYDNGTIYPQYSDYLLMAPNVAADQLVDPDNPITYAALMMIQKRTALNQAGSTCATALNSSFHEGEFYAFDSDMGVSIFLLNSMFSSAGALMTTAGKYIQIQALIGLSPDAGQALQIVGDAWDMFVTTKYYPLDTQAFANNGKRIIAYRSQQAPCEATLWLALD